VYDVAAGAQRRGADTVWRGVETLEQFRTHPIDSGERDTAGQAERSTGGTVLRD
jgi:hypothetical protein